MAEATPPDPRTLTCVCGNQILYRIRLSERCGAEDDDENLEVVSLLSSSGTPITRCPRCGREVSRASLNPERSENQGRGLE